MLLMHISIVALIFARYTYCLGSVPCSKPVAGSHKHVAPIPAGCLARAYNGRRNGVSSMRGPFEPADSFGLLSPPVEVE